MSRTIQIKRGNTTDNDGYTGKEGEITINMDDWSLRVHDGSTAGGHEISTDSEILDADFGLIDDESSGSSASASQVLNDLKSENEKAVANLEAIQNAVESTDMSNFLTTAQLEEADAYLDSLLAEVNGETSGS